MLIACAPSSPVPVSANQGVAGFGGQRKPKSAGRLAESHGDSQAKRPFGTEDNASKGAISQLQEYVQDAGLFCMPSNCSVLQWDFDTRMCSGSSLEFRATVAFLLDGMPHHSVGVWKQSKKLAQRDAAERALSFYAHRWGDLVAAIEQQGGAVHAVGPAARTKLKQPQKRGGGAPSSPASTTAPLTPESNSDPEMFTDHCSKVVAAASATLEPKSDVETLRDFCSKLARRHPAPVPQYRHEQDTDGRFRSFVRVKLLGVSHTFSGSWCNCQESSELDVAQRVLWYLQCPGREDAFEPDHAYVRAAAQTIPEPSASWAKEDDGEGPEKPSSAVRLEEKHSVERKLTMMRVQNRLQRVFAGRIEPSTSIWHWTYEKDGGPTRRAKGKSVDCDGPAPLFRATVHVPLLADQPFVGRWAHGQREAQIDACTQIAKFLDAQFPSETDPHPVDC